MREEDKKMVSEFRELWGERGVLRAHWIIFLRSQPSNAHITLTTNKTHADLPFMQGLLKNWLGSVERGWLKGRYYKKPPEQRITGFFFCESMHRNPHVHGIIHIPPKRIDQKIKGSVVANYFDEQWQKLMKSGDAETNFDDNPNGASRYQTKQYLNVDAWQNVIMAQDFWPAN